MQSCLSWSSLCDPVGIEQVTFWNSSEPSRSVSLSPDQRADRQGLYEVRQQTDNVRMESEQKDSVFMKSDSRQTGSLWSQRAYRQGPYGVREQTDRVLMESKQTDRVLMESEDTGDRNAAWTDDQRHTNSSTTILLHCILSWEIDMITQCFP